jgi:hypothetical protein
MVEPMIPIIGTRCSLCGMSAPAALAPQWCHRPECAHRPAPDTLPPTDEAMRIAELEAKNEQLFSQVKIADDQWDAKCDRITALEAKVATLQARGDRLAELLQRYLNETPTGHSPHMICLVAEEAIAEWRK